jgi:hypothetical protein
VLTGGVPIKGINTQRLISYEFAPVTGLVGWVPGTTWAENTHKYEQFGRRSAYYATKEAPYITGAAAALVSYFFSPIAGAAVAAVGGEAERWGEYYVDREQGASTWDARKKARTYSNRTWEAGAVGAGLGSAASFAVGSLSGVSSVSVEAGATAAPQSSFYASSSAADLADPQFQAAQAYTQAYNAEVAASNAQIAALSPSAQSLGAGNPGILGQAWNTISGLPSYVYNNPTAAFGLAGTGFGVAQQLEPQWFGKTGQQVATDFQTVNDIGGLLNSLGGGGSAAGGGGPGLGGADASIGWGESPASSTSNIPTEYVLVGAALILLVVILG